MRSTEVFFFCSHIQEHHRVQLHLQRSHAVRLDRPSVRLHRASLSRSNFCMMDQSTSASPRASLPSAARPRWVTMSTVPFRHFFSVNDICLVRFPGGHRFPLGITKYLQERGDHEEKSLNSCVNPYIDKDYLAQKMGLTSTSSRTVSPYVSVDVEGPCFRSGWSKLSDQERFLFRSRRDYEKTVHGIKRDRGGVRKYSWKSLWPVAARK